MVDDTSGECLPVTGGENGRGEWEPQHPEENESLTFGVGRPDRRPLYDRQDGLVWPRGG
jgi:hypothetical protein